MIQCLTDWVQGCQRNLPLDETLLLQSWDQLGIGGALRDRRRSRLELVALDLDRRLGFA